MITNSKEKIIKEIAKNDLEKVVLSLRIWRDQILIDMRINYKSKEGEWLNTKKGVSLPVGDYKELKEGILALESEIENFELG